MFQMALLRDAPAWHTYIRDVTRHEFNSMPVLIKQPLNHFPLCKTPSFTQWISFLFVRSFWWFSSVGACDEFPFFGLVNWVEWISVAIRVEAWGCIRLLLSSMSSNGRCWEVAICLSLCPINSLAWSDLGDDVFVAAASLVWRFVWVSCLSFLKRAPGMSQIYRFNPTAAIGVSCFLSLQSCLRVWCLAWLGFSAFQSIWCCRS